MSNSLNVKKYVRKKYKPYKLYVPENIDIDSILSQNPFQYEGMPKKYCNYRDKLLYILHLISSIPNSKNDFDFDFYKGYTPINREALSNRVHDYPFYINYLKENGIIEESKSYSAGNYSKGLRFTSSYQTNVKSVIITCQSLIKSIVSKNHNRNVEEEKKLFFLKLSFNDKLQIDYPNALIFLEKDKENLRKKAIERATKKEKKLKKGLMVDIDSIVRMGSMSKHLTVMYFKENSFSYNLKIDNKSGRFHTPLTRLQKELRKYITYDNKQLVSIDITNSQPFMSLVLLDTKLFYKLNIKNLIIKYNTTFKDKEIIDFETGEVIYQKSITYTMFENLLKSNQKKEDVILYKEIVSKGIYYEKFAEILINKGLMPNEILEIADSKEKTKAIRSFAKQATFLALFDKYNAASYNPFVRAFSSVFPNVYKAFRLIKSGKTIINNKSTSNYNALALILQRVEAVLILRNTCSQIYLTNTEIPFFTIHDSVITTEENKDEVQKILVEEINKMLGVIPNLVIESW